MSYKSFYALLVLTVVAVMATIVMATMSPDYTSVIRSNDRVAPALASGINDVRKLVVKSSERTLTFNYGEDALWHILERNDYPVKSQVIQEMLYGLSLLELNEAKTNREDWLYRLELDIPDKADAKGTQVQVFDDEGVALADLILGKNARSTGGLIKGGIYVRRTDETQAWLAAGRIDLGLDVKDWIDHKIIDVKRPRLKSVNVVHADGAEVQLLRLSNSDEDLTLLNIPEGQKLQSEFRRDAIAAFISDLSISDVRPRDQTLPEVARVRYLTMDGLQVVMALDGNKELGHWVSFQVESSSSETAAESATITARTKGWQFKVADWKSGDIKRKMIDLVEPETVEPQV